ncbi:uncharacterized protein LOC112185819 isoform X1 [Rosa chinensis]|uniref:uncharacterized protein LOC112185819 isoform X1 n=1 Tax=Rosa chinensis TaxID=74649 RepID=UPI000D08D4F1|nr:uncharacterized protein LOC112185819 isoform X1 [Rosa chinensis]
MGRKRGKKTVQKVAEEIEPQNERQEDQFTDPDAVERRISAVKAISDVEIEHVLTKLRLLRSYCTKEQRQTPVLQFFKENFPNLKFVKNEENGHLELEWIGDDGKVSMNDGTDLHLSLLNQFSMAHSGCQTLGGFEFSSKAERSRFLGGDNLQIRDFVLEEPFDTQMLGQHDSLQTPGVSSLRLSIGVTPKTRRLPKPGETLLSVHGSPLGVYKEDDMEAINVYCYAL